MPLAPVSKYCAVYSLLARARFSGASGDSFVRTPGCGSSARAQLNDAGMDVGAGPVRSKGRPGQISTATWADERKNHPQECTCSAPGRAQGANSFHPDNPNCHKLYRRTSSYIPDSDMLLSSIRLTILFRRGILFVNGYQTGSSKQTPDRVGQAGYGRLAAIPDLRPGSVSTQPVFQATPVGRTQPGRMKWQVYPLGMRSR